MEINKKLDTDNDIEFLESGDLAHASNIVTNNSNNGILNENSIEPYFELTTGETIVGHIACSNEFVIFTSSNRIIRCDEDGNNIDIKTNWNWDGGKVIGTYTYNINNELIIAITELDANDRVPLKIINLNKPDYVEGENDNKYTLSPEIPHFNLINYKNVTGNNIYKGTYNFFIRFKKDKEYTGWYKLGYPIHIYNVKTVVVNKQPVQGRGSTQRSGEYSYAETVDNKQEKTNTNIILAIDINHYNDFEYYQIGYFVNTINNEIKTFSTNDFSINTVTVTIDNFNNTDQQFSLDELTSTSFNIYDVKTLYNYNNRLYIANYKEENPNIDVKDINTKDIIVKAIGDPNDPYIKYNDLPLPSNSRTRAIDVDNNNIPDLLTNEVTPATEIEFNNKYGITLNYNITFKGTTYTATRRFYSSTIVKDINEIKYIVIPTRWVLQSTISDNIKFSNTANAVNLIIYFDVNGNIKYKFTGWIDDTNEITTELLDSCSIYYTDGEYGSTIEMIVLDLNSFSISELLNIPTTNESIIPLYFYKLKYTYEDVVLDSYFEVELADIRRTTTGFSLATIVFYGTPNNIKRSYFNLSGHKYYVITNIYDTIKRVFGEGSYSFKFDYAISNDANITKEDVEKTNLFQPDYHKFDDIIIAYNIDTKTYHLYCPFVFISEFNTTYVHGRINDEFEIYKGDIIETHNLKDFFSKLTYIEENIDKTFDDLKDVQEITYEWTVDRQPNNNDFNIDYKYTFVTSNLINGTSEYYYNVSARPYGLFNKVKVSDTLITVDKDFFIVMLYRDYYNKYITTQPIEDYNRITLVNKSTGLHEYEAKADNLYIGFYKDYVKPINNINCYIGIIFEPNPSNNKDTTIVYNPKTDEGKYNILIEGIGTNGKDAYTDYNPTIGIPVESLHDNENDVSNFEFSTLVSKYAINHCVYNFFIHYVYPNGSHTDGIQIFNNTTYSNRFNIGTGTKSNGQTETLYYDANEDTKIIDIKNKVDEYKTLYTKFVTTNAHEIIKFFNYLDDVYVCNLYPIFNNNNIALYRNANGDKLFRGSILRTENDYKTHAIKFLFDNIKMYPQFVGYFISYEDTEEILIAEGNYVNGNTDTLTSHFGYIVSSGSSSARPQGDPSTIKFFYPEFNIIKKIGGNVFLTNGITRLTAATTKSYNTPGSRPQYRKGFFEQYTGLNFNSNLYNYNGYTTIGKKLPIVTSMISSPGENNTDGKLTIKVSESSIQALSDGFMHFYTSDRGSTTISGYKVITSGLLFNITNNIYISKEKKLISLGYIQYTNYKEGNNYNYGYNNFPYNYNYFFVDASTYTFNKSGVQYSDESYVPLTNAGQWYWDINNYDDNYGSIYGAPIDRINRKYFSLYPLFARNIKEEPQERYFEVKYSAQTSRNMLVNRILPLYSNDLLALNTAFYDYTDKAIINYNPNIYSNFVEEYGKTIRRSDIISNESVDNKWRIFRPEEYKIISENKGNIINVVGIGGYLIAHCEHSMFIFNRDSSMETRDKDVQLVIPDAFDIDYVEMFTSTKGYAGIQKVNQFVCSNYGYIFYDSDAHKIYRFNEKTLDDITPGFINMFKHNIVDLNLVIDEANERMICLGSIIINDELKHFTISYSFNNNYWISTHTYWYSNCFNTKNNVYFINNKDTSVSIDKFNTNKFNNYTNIINNDINLFNGEFTDKEIPCSYIDVVFNNNNIDKVLNYISYIVNKATDDNYSGFKMLIYTNCCYTDYIDISVPKRSMKDYKHPYYRYGQWVFNWFRNKVANIDTKNPIIRGNGKLHPDTKFLTTKSLNDALVVGKYFVVRFIFYSDDKRISVNDIQCY